MELDLRKLDPTNAAGWMGAFGRAVDSKNDEEATQALFEIGQTQRFDVYYTVLIARLTRAAAQSKTMSVVEASVSVIGAIAMQALPAYGAVSQRCKGEPLQQSLEVCRRVAKVFENGDTYLTEMFGVAIAKRACPENSPEWSSAIEARRIYDYRSKAWRESNAWDAKHIDMYLDLCTKNRREQDVFRAQLVAIGLSPDLPSE